jgi:poly-gamma-glutamate capsule biosynthesis protein CapA/YwtB (metallophosphatase superfamily)
MSAEGAAVRLGLAGETRAMAAEGAAVRLRLAGETRAMTAEGPALRLALAGDTMLGRGVAEALERAPQRLLAPEVVELAAAADLFVLNLECCISARGERWTAPGKPFFFRAPPRAAEWLAAIGVDCVTLANNHALDYGPLALLDTLEHLRAAGVAWVGAGPVVAEARAPRVLEARGLRLAVLGASDHPADFAAATRRPGIAFADLRADPGGGWLTEAVAAARQDADAVLVTPHWGPNMTARPPAYVRKAAGALVAAGATLVAGHSAHVAHGAAGRTLYDLGDFIDDYAVHQDLRNDLGLMFLVEMDAAGPRTLEAVPLELDFCHTRLARGEGAAWIRRRFARACRELGAEAVDADGTVRVDLGA